MSKVRDLNAKPKHVTLEVQNGKHGMTSTTVGDEKHLKELRFKVTTKRFVTRSGKLYWSVILKDSKNKKYELQVPSTAKQGEVVSKAESERISELMRRKVQDLIVKHNPHLKEQMVAEALKRKEAKPE